MIHEIFFQNILKTFIAIDPVALIPIFAALSSSISINKILKLSVIIFFTSSFVISFFAIFGNIFLEFIGISIFSFQIAGGIFLFFIAFEMLFEKRSERKKKLIKSDKSEEYLISMSIFPISIPLIVGPSAITLSILISENFDFSFTTIYVQILPLILVIFLTCILFIFSGVLSSLLGMSLILILQKLFGIILGALAVEFILSGLKLDLV